MSPHLFLITWEAQALCFEISHVGRFWQLVVKNTMNAYVEWTITCQARGVTAMRLLRDLNYPIHVPTHFPRINGKCIGNLKRTVSNLCTTCSQTVSAWQQQANSDSPPSTSHQLLRPLCMSTGLRPWHRLPLNAMRGSVGILPLKVFSPKSISTRAPTGGEFSVLAERVVFAVVLEVAWVWKPSLHCGCLGVSTGPPSGHRSSEVPEASSMPETRHRFAVRLETTLWEMEEDQEMLIIHRHVTKFEKGIWVRIIVWVFNTLYLLAGVFWTAELESWRSF